jgi:sigma-B regulation protein RsbU (phosphoserine phosphatase)
MLAVAATSIPPELQRMLRGDLPYVFIGIALITIALAGLALAAMRRERDLVLASFSLFAGLYGLRLVLQCETASMLFHSAVFNRISEAIDYTVPIPAMLFFYRARLLSPVGKHLAWLLASVSTALFLTTMAVGRRNVFDIINSVAVIAALLQFLYGLWRIETGSRPEVRFVRLGLVAFIVLALLNNASGLLQLHWPRIEPLGFLVFIGCLGYVTAQRMFSREEQLIAIERELEIARRIQLSILPGDFPLSGRLRVAARYLPMTAIAGDFYDFVVAEEDRAALLIADVSGHGVPAALIASMVKLAAAGQRENAHDPASFLAGMNTALHGNTQTQFVTAACAYFDLKRGELRYSAAAHPPMLRLRGGQIDLVEENGLMLAAFDFSAYRVKQLGLEPGDRFLLYTDGAVEAANAAGEFFGDERLQARLAATAQMTVEKAVEVITSAIREWSSVQDDDITLLLCEVNG